MNYNFKFDDYPILDDYQTIKLIDMYKKSGKSEFFDEVILSNLKLVIYLINSYPDYRFQYVQREDLVSVGVMGLMYAIENFDHNYDTKFSGYATLIIKHKLTNELNRHFSIVRLPRQLYLIKNKIKKLREQHLSNAQIADRLNIDYYSLLIYDRLSASTNSSSIHEDIVEDCTLESLLNEHDPQFDIIDHKIDDKILSAEILNVLNDREKDIIIRRFGLFGKAINTLEELAEVYSCSKERVRQIESRSLRLLRKAMNESYANKN